MLRRTWSLLSVVTWVIMASHCDAGGAMADGPALLRVGPLNPADAPDELHKLMRARYNAALAETRDRYAEARAGKGGRVVNLGEASERLAKAGLALDIRVSAQAAFLRDYVLLLVEVERVARLRLEAGTASPADVEHVRYLRYDAEIKYLLMQRRAKNGE